MPKKPIIYDQGLTNMCQTYSVFGALGILTGMYISQKDVEKFIKDQKLKDGNPMQKGGLSSKDVANILRLKTEQVFWRDEKFMKAWLEGKPLILSMRVKGPFWIDTKDGRLDSYMHKRGTTEGHNIVIHRDMQSENPFDGYIVNSFGRLTPLCKFDLEKFDQNWLKLPTALIISLK